MFKGEEDFKFYVYEDQVFYLEKALIDNNIEFHNELGISTNIRTNKYYIKNIDRARFDKVSKEIKIDVFTDNQPKIETRLPKFKFNYGSFIAFLIILVTLFFILL